MFSKTTLALARGPQSSHLSRLCSRGGVCVRLFISRRYLNRGGWGRKPFSLARLSPSQGCFHQAQFRCLVFSEHPGSCKFTCATKDPASRVTTIIPMRTMSSHKGS